MEIKTIRWWTWLNNGWVKLSLQRGQKLEWSTGGPHEEGWSSEYETFEWIKDEDIIRHDWGTDGCDCDGRLSHDGQMYCHVLTVYARGAAPWYDDHFHGEVINRPPTVPWVELNHEVNDRFARAMGY